MANINNLQMAKTVCSDARLEVRKSFLGLCKTYVYRPTQSVVEARQIEYSAETGVRWEQILEHSGASWPKVLEGFNPVPAPNGSYLMEACISRDGQFVALQLFQYQQLGFEPATDVFFFEGETAQALALIL